MGASFNFAFAADSHLESADDRDCLAESLRGMGGVDFIVMGGDLTGSGEESQMLLYREALGACRAPVYSVFGGHDGNSLRAAGCERPTGAFRRFLGEPWYSFDVEGVRCLVHVAEHAFLSAAERLMQDDWLNARALEPGEGGGVIVFQHAPAPGIHKLFHGSSLKAVLHGHLHLYNAYYLGGALVASVPPICETGFMGTTRGYFRVSVKNGAVGIEFVPAEKRKRARPSPNALRAGGGKPDVSDDWPDISGGRRGRARDYSPGTNFELSWSRRLPGMTVLGSPAVDAGRVAVASVNADGPGGRLVMMDAADGRILWAAGLEAGVYHTPALSRGLVLVLEADGALSAFCAQTGARAWKAEIDSGPGRFAANGFCIYGGLVFIRTAGHFCALSLCDGSAVWKVPFAHSDWMGPSGSPAVFGEAVFVPAMRGEGVSAYSLEGELLWRTGGGRVGLERIAGGLCYSSMSGLIYFSGFSVENPGASGWSGSEGRLFAVCGSTGLIAWEAPLGSYNYTVPAEAGGVLAVSDMINGSVIGFDSSSGERLWSFRTGPPLQCLAPRKRNAPGVSSSPAIGAGNVYFGASDGFLYVVDLARGRELSRMDLNAPLPSSPAISGNSLFIIDRENGIMALTGR